MIISVASGKGGTGKTTLSLLLAMERPGVTLVDCDVEEPNCHLFLHPELENERPVKVMVPELDEEKCDGCGKCTQVCLFNALALGGQKPLLFDELCHSCGGCLLACPQGALSEQYKIIGTIQTGVATQNTAAAKLVSGTLKVGVPAAGPIIKEIRKSLSSSDDIILDCPPGTSCSMVATVIDSDFCLLVTEPTPFGLHDLNLAYRVVKLIGVPAAVVINKSDAGDGDGAVEAWCKENCVEVIAKIPDSREFAAAYAEGVISPEFHHIGRGIWDKLKLAGDRG